jgi:hypothetical protein
LTGLWVATRSDRSRSECEYCNAAICINHAKRDRTCALERVGRWLVHIRWRHGGDGERRLRRFCGYAGRRATDNSGGTAPPIDPCTNHRWPWPARPARLAQEAGCDRSKGIAEAVRDGTCDCCATDTWGSSNQREAGGSHADSLQPIETWRTRGFTSWLFEFRCISRSHAVTLDTSTTARIDIAATTSDGIEIFFSSAGDPLEVGEAFQFNWYNATSGNLINSIVGPYNGSGPPITNPGNGILGSVAGDPSFLLVTMLTGSFSFSSYSLVALSCDPNCFRFAVSSTLTEVTQTPLPAAPVPLHPSILAQIIAGLGLLGLLARRRKRKGWVSAEGA